MNNRIDADKNNIKVAMIVPGFFENEKDYGGAAAIYNLVEELSKNPEIELTIFSLYSPVNKSEYKFFNSKVYSFAYSNKIRKIDKLELWLKLKNKFKQEYKKNKIDLVHSLWASEAGYAGSKLAKK